MSDGKLHIVVHETLGFGGGGWGTGQHIYIVSDGKVSKSLRCPNSDSVDIIKWTLGRAKVKYQVHQIPYGQEFDEKLTQLLAKLCKG